MKVSMFVVPLKGHVCLDIWRHINGIISTVMITTRSVLKLKVCDRRGYAVSQCGVQ